MMMIQSLGRFLLDRITQDDKSLDKSSTIMEEVCHTQGESLALYDF